MDKLVLPELVVLGILILLSALLSGAEAAYFSLGRTRLKELAEQQGKTPGPLAPLLAQPHELLVTLLVGITVVNIGASALAAAIAERLFGGRGLPIAIGAMVFLLTVFGEVLPMTLAVEHPLRFASWVSRPVAWLSVLLTPIRIGLAAFTALTLRLVGSERQVGQPEISEEELRTLVDVGAREGVVERTEREMIHKVFELEDTLVREVMVPRPDMFCLDVSTPPGGDPAAAARAAPLPRAGVRGDHRPDRRRALHQGPAAAPRRAAARLRPPRASAPALLRAGVEAGRRAAARVPGQEAPPGHRGGRVRRHRGPRHPRGPARGAGRRDPRRVRRGRAPDPWRRRRAPSGSPASSPSTS